jgi:hypothetical protein
MSNVKWTITWSEDDTYDILRSGRSFAYGLASPEAAVAKIKRSKRYTPGDKVTATDEHGNRILIRL